MEKLQLLMEKYPEKVKSMVDSLYSENFKKKSKTIYHFKALGKVYDNDVFTKNYINFLTDVSKIHGIEFFKLCINSYYISEDPNNFNSGHKERNQIHKITDGIYVSGYSSTEKKIIHIQNICNLLGIQMTPHS